jgi:hypothetical protein
MAKGLEIVSVIRSWCLSVPEALKTGSITEVGEKVVVKAGHYNQTEDMSRKENANLVPSPDH